MTSAQFFIALMYSHFSASGKKSADEEDGRAQSAKVSISHQIETKDTVRPWTTQLIREQSVHRHRPKSASGMGPPKRAWVAGSERRVKSASSEVSDNKETAQNERDIFPDVEEEGGEIEEEYDITSNVYSSGHSTKEISMWDSHENIPAMKRPSGPASSTAHIFPNYPVYPDFPISVGDGHNTLKVSAPAVPIIEAIKEEIKKFEKKDDDF